MKIKPIAIAILACLVATGCSHGLSGVYMPKGGGMGNGLVMSKLEFINGQQEVFNIDDAGCLDGGNLFGKFCKN